MKCLCGKRYTPGDGGFDSCNIAMGWYEALGKSSVTMSTHLMLMGTTYKQPERTWFN